MKLVGLTTSLTIAGALLGALACEPARGQSPLPEFLAGAGDKSPAEFFPHASPFESVHSTPHFMLGYDDLWSEYRGAEIEQAWPEAELRLAHGPRRWPLLSLLGRWLDTLFAPLPRHKKHAPCPHCDLAWAATQTTEANEARQFEIEKFPEIPVPVPLPYVPPESATEPPAEPPVQPGRPAESRPRVEPPRVVEPPPVVEPTQPVEPEPPATREPVGPPKVPALPPANAIPRKRPTEQVPTEPEPAEPEPVEPEPVEHRPRELGPTFPPVIELAPEPVIPGQPPSAMPPSTLPPRNRIPQPKDRLPKNRVPASPAPR